MTSLRGSVVVVLVVLAALTTGCKKFGVKRCADDNCLFTPDEWRLVSSLANVSSTPPPPDPTNKYLPVDEWASVQDDGATIDSMPPVVKLGWRLYHDPRLSGDALDPRDTLGRAALAPRPPSACAPLVGVSCATCHDPVAFGGDVTSVPPNVSNGAGWYDVNTQQTLNVARFHPVFYWNGRTSTLWAQAAQVMESGVSMKGHRLRTLFVVAQHYLAEYADVFDQPPRDDLLRLAKGFTLTSTTKAFRDAHTAAPRADQDAASLVHVNVAKAIGAYEWFLRSDGSPFDRFVREGGNSSALSPAQKRGLKLFIGHASCVNCHNTPLFSDGRFHDIGVSQAGAHVPTVAACEGGANAPACDCRNGGTDRSCLPSGAFGGVQKRKNAEFGACSSYDDRNGGAGAPTCDEDLRPAWGSWRTPSLRDVAMTGPYMHDGLFATLADVVWHYDQGRGAEGGDGGSELAPLNLSDQDRDDLVAFLESLTGTPGPTALTTPPPVPAGGYLVCPPAGGPGDGGAGDEPNDGAAGAADAGDGG